MQRAHGDKTARTIKMINKVEGRAGKTQHKGRIRGKMIPQTSLLIYKITADEVLEVGEDRATTLAPEQGPRVLHSAVEMARMYVTMEVLERHSPQLEVKVMHLAGDGALTKVIAIGIEAMKHAPVLKVQLQGIDLAQRTGTPLLEVMESLSSS